jgi:membrane fusion protein, heavy metal efflux system
MTMKKHVLNLLALILIVFFFIGCSDKSADNYDSGEGKNQESQKGNGHEEHVHEGHSPEEHGHEGMDKVHLSALKFNSLGIKVDTLPTRSLSGGVDVNGRLALFPQHRATVTAILGANVTAIKVIEGEKIKKGQILAYLSHPNLANLQAAYVRAYNQIQYLEKEFERQKKLYEAGVSSGKTYQQTQANYHAMKGEVKSYEAQLKQLNINARNVKNGNIYQNVPVVSPIDGNIEKVLIQLGQYVDSNTTMFMIINLDYIHADLMVFEKDVYLVKKGQKVSFKVESVPGKILSARIFSVGKNFEQNPRAVHVHAEIEQKEYFLIPGMYINGKIHTQSTSVNALPEEAVVMEEGKSYIFMAEVHQEDGKTEWMFEPIEIRTGTSDEGWVEINLLEPLPKGAQVAWNNAYYLIAEMKKGETAHEH